MALVAPDPVDVDRGDGRVGATFGVLSALLLVGSFAWAHHWGPVAYALVASWALSTLAAFVLSLRTLRLRAPGRGLAWLGLLLALTSIFVFASTTAAMAAGYDPAGVCGGG